MFNFIKIKGARVHNLKNINCEIPRNKLVVVTGLSGSGKSSLVFDTIYAEGQRCYVESLSSYARQFIGLMNKPDVDLIEGLSPAISIDQKATSHNPRSTVGTITELYDYLRLLFARIGVPHCPKCGQKIKQHSVDEIVKKITIDYLNKKIVILAPIIRDKKGDHKNILNKISKLNYSHVKFDNNICDIKEAIKMTVDKQKKHNIAIVIDCLLISQNKESIICLNKSLKKALDLANGLVTIISDISSLKEITYFQFFVCPDCNISLSELEPRNFSFNSPCGACVDCLGIGTKLEIDPKLVINPNLTIAQGAIKAWTRNIANAQNQLMRSLDNIAKANGFDLNTQIKTLTKEQLNIVLYGSNNENCDKPIVEFVGVIPDLENYYKQTDSDYIRKEIEKYMRVFVCPACNGKRLKPEMLAVKIAELSIYDISSKTIDQGKIFFTELINSKVISVRDKKIASQLLKEIITRLDFLINVGLSYLTLDRPTSTLSGGEAQRIKLATQINSALTGVLYVLDEPSVGLHQKDNDKLINTLKKLRDLGNTIIVAEHDKSIMLAADWIIDVGPGAGEHGGHIVAVGTPDQIKKSSQSLTGQYLSGKKLIPVQTKYRLGNNKKLKIIKASEHNLKNIDCEIPLGVLVAITGVSGSGKSTLMTDVLVNALNQKFYRAKQAPGKYERIEGLEYIDKVISIDQSPIGRTPRSNPVTYTNIFGYIRDLFASLPEAKIKDYKAGCFSFNVAGGRCEACNGDGLIKIEMQFLSDVYVECDTCHGKRYNKEALEIYYKEKNIFDVLNMTVEEAVNFFKNIPSIYQKLEILNKVGLGYIKLGQPATTLSGGEAQRVKLATELSRRATGKTLYIMDEPTTGLHFEDIKKLLQVLNQLVDKGNTVLIIEHNLDVVKSVDWIIDLGPEGGDKGGEIIATGSPHQVAKNKKSYTGQYLAKVL
ncbi:MAG: excinuclease ABC subunit UvrA [Patescibacteria group bacterium]|nr:excinuclease ABC subunit UvrA [Patescibacteria group bacterium]MBU1870531.1 excinuclease ABC subunit UvrA [Patescibacteria group bacterium]